MNLVDDDVPVLAATADICFMVHLVGLFMKTQLLVLLQDKQLLVLLQDNCLDLVRCLFLHRLSGCMRNITAFCQHLLRPLGSRFGRYIGKTHILARCIGLADQTISSKK